jgi:hypothetical protein
MTTLDWKCKGYIWLYYVWVPQRNINDVRVALFLVVARMDIWLCYVWGPQWNINEVHVAFSSAVAKRDILLYYVGVQSRNINERPRRPFSSAVCSLGWEYEFHLYPTSMTASEEHQRTSISQFRQAAGFLHRMKRVFTQRSSWDTQSADYSMGSHCILKVKHNLVFSVQEPAQKRAWF